jgi:FAD/FMN-containing dehydrogenase
VEYVLSVFCFGHAGDQNLHLNVVLRLREGLSAARQVAIKQCVKSDLERAVVTQTMKWNGSISAEHGIGQQKSHLLHLCRTPAEVRLMHLLKTTMDPKGILNPGKIIALS